MRVGARDSPLSRAQVEEVRALYPDVHFDPIFVKTTGDLDRKTSLKNLDKSNFFTKELDEMLFSRRIDLAIHSAKDLPDPLPKGLCILAITKGVDPRDALVFRENETLETLPKNAKIATSSLRREEEVLRLRDDLQVVDIRGNVDERLLKLETYEIDGLVVAEAALIRLKKTKLNRMFLNSNAPLQGKLALVVLDEKKESLSWLRPHALSERK